MTLKEQGCYAVIEAGDSGPVAVLLPAPAAPTVTSDGTQLNLLWPPVNGALSYQVYRSTTPGSETLLASGLSSTSYADISAAPNTTYYYKISAVDSVGPGPLSPETSGEIVPPAQPTGGVATSNGVELNLSWNAVSAVTTYNVYRGTTPGGEVLHASGLLSNSYADSLTVVGNTTYYYKVSAVNSAGEGPLSAEFTGIINPPAAPTGVTATPGLSNIVLGWNVIVDAEAYNVYRGTTPGGETLLASNVTPNSYTDSTATAGITYYYKISGTNLAGEGSLSVEVSATIVGFPPWATNNLASSGFMTAYANFVGGQTQTNASATINIGLSTWLGAVTANGFIYILPYGAGNCKVIDPSTNTVSATITIAGQFGGGVLAYNGKIYCPPFGSGNLAIIDPSNNTVSTIAMTGQYQGGVMATTGKIYFCPQGTGNVAIVDPATNSIDVTTIALTGTYISATLAPNGKIYMMPQGTGNIAIIDPSTNTVSTLALAGNWYGSALGSNGMIYAAPNSAGHVAIIDPVAGTVDATTIVLAGVWTGAIAGADGHIYFVPGGGGKLGILNIGTNIIDTSFSTPSSNYLGGCLGPNGKLYLAPNTAAFVGVMQTAITCSTDMVQSRYLNKF